MTDPTASGLRISIRVHSHLRFTDLFHVVLTQVAKEVPIPPDRIDWVALSLREAVNNAVLHGNRKNPDKWIEVEMEALPDEFVIRVWDEGGGFDTSQLSDPRNPENLFRPNGRGIFLIKQFSDRVTFRRRADGKHCIELAVNLDAKDPQEAANESSSL